LLIRSLWPVLTGALPPLTVVLLKSVMVAAPDWPRMLSVMWAVTVWPVPSLRLKTSVPPWAAVLPLRVLKRMVTVPSRLKTAPPRPWPFWPPVPPVPPLPPLAVLPLRVSLRRERVAP
jgi:hypothetical protein